jgi:phage shock protein A
MTTAPYEESVREAVTRETARRKRVFLTFLGLLLIPIAIGAYALSKAPTEIEKVAADVTPLVTSRVSGEISERVTKDVSARTEPLIRQNVAREITGVTNDITQLRTSVQKTSELVQRVTPQLAALPELTNRISAFDVHQGRQGRDLMAIRVAASSSLETANANKEALAALTSQIAEVNRQLRSLQARVKALENPR